MADDLDGLADPLLERLLNAWEGLSDVDRVLLVERAEILASE